MTVSVQLPIVLSLSKDAGAVLRGFDKLSPSGRGGMDQ